jgi:hypothetical protein
VAWIRRVRMASGATAVQIAEYDGGRRKIVAHVGSAHTEAELGILLERARERLADPAQCAFDLGIEPAAPRARLVTREAAPALFDAEPPGGAPAAAGPPRVVSTDSRVLFQALDGVFGDLGFGVLDDDVFRDLVLARVVEPTSVLDTRRVLADLGRKAASDKTMRRTLVRCADRGYRDRIAELCFAHALASGNVSLILYDVTTLYFESWRPQLWLGVNGRGPLTAGGIYQAVARRGRQCGVTVYPHRFRHHFSHTWLDRGGAERDLMELNGWTSPQMLTRYGASARGARARRSYDRIMDDST